MTQNQQPTADTPEVAAADLRRGVTPLRRIPVNAYRIQLGPDCDLNRAATLVDYLVRLGATDCYTSPYLTASRGSTSGYDVCDHTTIHPELGGEPAFEAFARALTAAGLGHVLDFVPNHMGTDETRNRWWRDLLTHGAASPVADFFDVDWRPVDAALSDKLLLPILDKPYGAALDDGDLKIERLGDEIVLRYGERVLPLAPGTIDEGAMAGPWSAETLHAVLERQAYRLAYWRTASDEINYRRFFDVGELVGLRTEDPRLFSAMHARVAAWVRDGPVTSLRIDHPDGLADPAEYFERLQSLCRQSDGAAIHVVAEKILTAQQMLPAEWAVHGTTGYEFLNRVGGLFVHPVGMAAIRRAYTRFTGDRQTFEEVAYEGKTLIMSTTLASEVQLLAHALHRIAQRDRHSRDFTLNNLRRALVEFVACLSTYRTYLAADRTSAPDVAEVHAAAAAARDRHPALEPSVFQFLEALLLAEPRTVSPADPVDADDRRRLCVRLQQFTGSVFAKGVEDTAFYRYQPLLSLNEVGGEPSADGQSPEAFHRHNASRAERAPFGLATTSTHDTKLGEDARARISVLSELPEAWARVSRDWRRLLSPARTAIGQTRFPDAQDEYRFYQALVGTWPAADVAVGPAAEPGTEYVTRLVEFMRKSAREAKRRTSWINVNTRYEDALVRFVTEALSGPAGARFREGARPFARRVARVGVVNALAQLVLKIGAPAAIDVYQGAELWDLSLVDPDNRRPVDFDRRRRLLDDLEPILQAARAGEPVGRGVRLLLDDWPTGAIKLFVTAAGLRLRRDHPQWFLGAAYQPLNVETAGVPDVVAYLRRTESGGVMVAAPRFVAGVMGSDGQWPIGDAAWTNASVRLPQDLAGVPFKNALTGVDVVPEADRAGPFVTATALFAHCPVGLWTIGR